MAREEDAVELFQGVIAAFIAGYLLLKFFEAVPTEGVSSGPFSDAYWIFSLMPWLLFVLGVVLLLSMFAEVFDL